jgi:hypothetical protein
MALLFPALPSRFSPDTGPRSLALPGSSSPDLTATSEYYPLYTCTSALASVRLPWGFFLLRDISTKRPLPPGIPLPDYVPPSAFLTLSTVCSARCLAGLFHPAAVSEVHSSGVCPDRQPPWLVARPFPLGVRAAHLHRASSLLQRASPAFRALIRPSVRCCRRVV